MFPLFLPLPAEQSIAHFKAFRCKRIQHQTGLFSTFCFIAYNCRKGLLKVRLALVPRQWCTDMGILQSGSSPKFFIKSISENSKLCTPTSNPNPKLLTQLHIRQDIWYCLFCLSGERLWLFSPLSKKHDWLKWLHGKYDVRRGKG